MKKYILLLCLPLLASFFLLGLSNHHAAAFDPFGGSVCQQKNSEGQVSAVCSASGDNPLVGPHGVIDKIANIFAVITGVAAIVVIMVSGFEYVRSSGDSAKINKAKNGILFAIIGLVIVALSRALVALAVSKL
jgi:hypothetical protein